MRGERPPPPASLDGRSAAPALNRSGCARILLLGNSDEGTTPLSRQASGECRVNTFDPRSQHVRFILYYLLSFGLLCLKSLDAITNPQFWAEDGAIFYAQQTVNYWPQLATPYAGYLHVVPRLIAWLSSSIDPLYLPLIYNISAITINAACVAYSILELSPIVGAGLVFISFFLLPTAGDIFGTLTNVQWFLQFPLVLCVLRPGSNKYGTAGEVTVWLFIIIACLTGPFCLVVTPILTGLLLIRRLNVLEIAARWNPIFVKFAEALGSVTERIPRGRIAALLVGSVLQGIVVTTNKIGTPDTRVRADAPRINHIWPRRQSSPLRRDRQLTRQPIPSYLDGAICRRIRRDHGCRLVAAKSDISDDGGADGHRLVAADTGFFQAARYTNGYTGFDVALFLFCGRRFFLRDRSCRQTVAAQISYCVIGDAALCSNRCVTPPPRISVACLSDATGLVALCKSD